MLQSTDSLPSAMFDSQTAAEERERLLAAIDIGTNSIHMVVVKIQPALPTFVIIAREKDTARLGDRDPKTGELTEAAMQRAIAALHRCKDLATSLEVEHIAAVATSAVREAPNGREFINRVASEIGIDINLISGQEEARRIYLGVLSGMEFYNRPHVIVDIGGGSTELILGDGREPRFLSSSKVGAVRLTGELLSTDPVSDRELERLRAYVRIRLERPVEQILARLEPGEMPRLVGTSGTAESLAMLHAMETQGSVPSPLQGYQFSRRDLAAIAKRLAGMKLKERLELPEMSARRAEIIVAGAYILLEVMTMLDIEEIVICERALREGIIVDWMLGHGLIENRLRYHQLVRQRSTIKLAHKYGVHLESSHRIADFALSLFDQLQGKLHFWGEEERELLWTAAILHNCGVHVSHAAHHKHSYYLIRNGELFGFNERELEIVANLARYHRKSKPKKKHENFRNLVEKCDRQIASELSAILRLAIALDRRQIGAIREVTCLYHSTAQELHLHLVPSQADDDCDLERWSLEDKKAVFEEEFNVQVVAALMRPNEREMRSLGNGHGEARIDWQPSSLPELYAFAGKLQLSLDPIEYQRQERDAW